MEIKDYFLQPYLISLGKAWNLHNDTDEAYGLKAYEMVYFLERYLYEVCQFNENEVSVCMQRSIDVGKTNFEKNIKEQISNGNPVIYCGYSVDVSGLEFDFNATLLNMIGGHAMIAYSVYEESSYIKLNNCWNTTVESNLYNDSNSTPYVFWNVAIWLEINEDALPHNCTDAYVDINTGETLCACEIYCGTHPNGRHTLGNVYSTYTSSNHERLCTKCGEGVTENHSLINSKYSGTQHIDYCVCGYETVGSHSYTSYTKYSSTQHRSTCSCGYSKLSAHIIRDSSATIKTCIYCKAIVESGGGAIIGMALGNISYITENGSYIRPDGVIVISDIDYELLMNGELDIYALACDHDVE